RQPFRRHYGNDLAPSADGAALVSACARSRYRQAERPDHAERGGDAGGPGPHHPGEPRVARGGRILGQLHAGPWRGAVAAPPPGPFAASKAAARSAVNVPARPTRPWLPAARKACARRRQFGGPHSCGRCMGAESVVAFQRPLNGTLLTEAHLTAHPGPAPYR